MIDFAYGRGDFDQSDTALTSAALAGYSFGLITLALREVVSRGLFSLRDTRTPTLIALIGMVANGIGDIVLGRALGAFGLALTPTLSFSLIFFLTARALGRRAELPWDRWVGHRCPRGAVLALARPRVVGHLEPHRRLAHVPRSRARGLSPCRNSVACRPRFLRTNGLAPANAGL